MLALNAANGMMRALQALNERRVKAAGAVDAHGIGVNTGEAIAGNIGSPKRMDSPILGDAVNLTRALKASRRITARQFW